MGHRARFGRDFGTGGAKNGTPGEGLREFGGEIDSGKGGTAGRRGGTLPLGRTQPQRAMSEAEGRCENGRGRGQAARRTHSTGPGGAGIGTPGKVREEEGAPGAEQAGEVQSGAVRPGGVQREMKMDRPWGLSGTNI